METAQVLIANSWIRFFFTLFMSISLVWTAFAALIRLAKRWTRPKPVFQLFCALRPALQTLAFLVVGLVVLPSSPIDGGLKASIEHAMDLGVIACVAWALIVLVEFGEETLQNHYRMDMEDNLIARRVRTRLQVFHHIIIFGIVFLSVAVALMTFPYVRSLGASLLASAGLVGIIAGMAARPALANLIAGVQIAITEPIRIDDAVIVEGEWGNVEEIYATYVVVRLWDLRRMILPLSYFIERPFQNWTRESSDILGNVLIYADYRVDVEPLRTELRLILQSTPLWSGKVCILQMSDANERSVQLRALMDARNASDAWDLRCYVRERLVAFLQKKSPTSLPRFRMEQDAPTA